MGSQYFIEMDIRELDIEAPWGNIAVKLWGNENDPAVLSAHGIMDNAGTFDEIIPLLPKYFYICIDLPGHGKSSHFPSHLPIHTVNYLIAFKLVMDYFKRDKYIIMGHSYGGQIGIFFTQMYPEQVEKLIIFDTIHTLTVPSKYFAEYLQTKVKNFLETEKKLSKNNPPQYTYKEARDRMITTRLWPLTEKAVQNLLKRMLIPVGNDKFQLSLDQRMKSVISPLHDSRYAIETLKEFPLNCPVLIIFGIENRGQRHLLRPILNHLKKQRNITVKYLPGHHDVHQTDPEIVAPHVVQFLNFQKSKL